MLGFKRQISSILKVLSRDQIKVAFIGQTSNGKSTTLNAILQSDFLPMGMGCTTNCFLSVHGSDSPVPYIWVPGSDGKKNMVCLFNKYYKFLLCNNYMYDNFHPFTPAADYPHWSIFAIANLHPKTKENCQLTQSSSIVFVDMISLSMQWINFHASCFWCFFEIVKICSKKKSISWDQLWERNHLKWIYIFLRNISRIKYDLWLINCIWFL